MAPFLRVLVVMFAATAAILHAGHDFVQRALVVKFRQGSQELSTWLRLGRTGSLPLLTEIVGPHRTRPYLRDAVLIALAQRLHQQAARTARDPIASLQAIAIVECERNIDITFLARKLARHPAIEYAEPLPVHRVLFTPNDSLFAFQYHLTKIRASDAWDSIPSSTSDVLIAIVDTGVDITHEDLADVIFINSGETGTDSQGRDKRTNGIDDDGNGFIDDWHGWDMASDDNDPRPGNPHGTHVAGIAAAEINNGRGTAGVCNRARILPIKCATDSPNAPSIVAGYEGIAYAAALGAKVINCSWGGGTYSQAEQEVITTAVGLGSVIVAAAGNGGVEELIYPAGYSGVISVAAVGSNDVRASFSSYHPSTGISAPGVSILSTYPQNRYGFADGTSMASPVVAGAAALVRAKYPHLSPSQVIARLKATADPIDQIPGNRNRNWMGKLGTGRVNAFAAVTAQNVRYVEVISTTVTDNDGDGVFEPGNVVQILPTFQNMLSPVSNAKAVIRPIGSGASIFTFTDSLIDLGTLEPNVVLTASQPFRLPVPPTTPQNFVLTCQILVTDGSATIGRGLVSFVVMPTYRTLRNGAITLTVNSSGNFAYNDYPTNSQGEGFRYYESPSVLFEAGLIVGYGSDNLSDVARNETGNAQNIDFQFTTPAVLSPLSSPAGELVHASFADQGLATQANVEISQHVYAFNEDGKRDFVLSSYEITNHNSFPIPAMYCGIYADWDIGPSGRSDVALWSDEDGFYYCYNTQSTTLPYVGMQVVSAHSPNAFMIDNDGTTVDNPGVYDGYTRAEKWRTISSGIARRQSNVTDASAVIAAGPFAMESGQTERVVFSIFAGKNLDDLRSAARAARQSAQQLLNVTPLKPQSNPPSIIVAPNPVTSSTLTIEYTLGTSTSEAQLSITDATGRVLTTISLSEHAQPYGRVALSLDESIATGTYFAIMRTQHAIAGAPFILVR